MKVKKTGLSVLVLIMSVVLFASYVSAFGIGSAYHQDHPLQLSAGETRDISFNLQNGPGPEDITVRPSIGKGSEVMKLIDSSDVLVVVGGSVDVMAKVTVPGDAEIGDIYSVEITFNTVTEGESGTFGLGSSVGKGFDVVVVPSAEELAAMNMPAPESSSSWVIYLIAGIAILAILIIWFKFKKK